MRIQELEDLEKDIKVNGLKEVKSQQIYRAQNLFNSDGLFSEEIFGQTNDERSYRCGYIKLPIHVFNPFVAVMSLYGNGNDICGFYQFMPVFRRNTETVFIITPYDYFFVARLENCLKIR